MQVYLGALQPVTPNGRRLWAGGEGVPLHARAQHLATRGAEEHVSLSDPEWSSGLLDEDLGKLGLAVRAEGGQVLAAGGLNAAHYSSIITSAAGAN